MKFRDRTTEAVWLREPITPFGPELQRQARRRLLRLAAATSLRDLAQIRGNRLKKLHGDRAGQWSIRINDQYRICFRWEDNEAQEVEITDYHR